MEHAWILHTQNMSVGYKGKLVAEEIEIALKPGEILTLLGPNGSGKSTILKSLAGQLKLLSGTVYLKGFRSDEMTEHQRARFLSVLLTGAVHPELMTCLEVVEAGRYPYTGVLGVLSQEDRKKALEALELVGGLELRNQPFLKVSDGQKQRILLARAVCQEPSVILLDEPTSYLDIRYKLEFLGILKDLTRRKQMAVIMSLHEVDLAQKISDQILCVHRGRAERLGTPEEIFKDGYISRLYGIQRGSWNEIYSCPELEAVSGTPEIFVIGGGGQGIGVYRKLQRQGIPFSAGILWENDVDYPVAAALAVQVIAQKSYHPISEELFQQALHEIRRCRRVLCPLTDFGPFNQACLKLKEYARGEGMLEEIE